MTTIYAKMPLNKENDRKVYQRIPKDTIIFHSNAFQNTAKLGDLV
jgi:hypothetical protein